MAHSEELTNWIFDSREELGLEVTRFSWPSEWIPGLIHIGVSVTVDNINVVGHGSDFNENVALNKAFAEAVERWWCIQNGHPSLGFAAHIDETLCEESAGLEFLERESFFHHLALKKPFRKTTSEISSSILEKSASPRVKIESFALSTVDGYSSRLVVISGIGASSPFGGFIGLACAKTPREAVHKALVESLRNFNSHLKNPFDSMSLGDFSKIQKPTAFDRRALFLNLDYFDIVKGVFLSSSNEKEQSRNDVSFELTSVSLKNTPFEKAPLHLKRAIGSIRDSDFPHFLG